MRQTKQLFFLWAAASLPLACSLDQDAGEGTQYSEHVAVVVNQGNYSEKNGSISYFYEDSKAMQNGVVENLGSLVQSAALTENGNMFIVCNAPDKLEVVDNAANATLTRYSITNALLVNPRYLAWNNDYLFVTNWGNGVGTDWITYPQSYVLVLTRDKAHAFVKQIECGSDAEDIVLVNDKLYVAVAEGVAVIPIKDMGTTADATPEKIITAPTYTGAKHFIVDDGKRLWVSYSDFGLAEIDLSTETVVGEYKVPIDWMGQIAVNPTTQKIYTYNTDYSAQTSAIYEFDMAKHTYKTFAAGSYFYSIGVSPWSQHVYTSEANNFTSNSELLVFDANGNKLENYLTGIGTCDFEYFTISTE
ncbi:MAG: hypothetical protein LBT48_04595 [Prevotellaceae bacterium]|jgi:hypothetical protein|nr:hypothetical protein [Prevotellaceae bacterium]